MTAGKRQAGSGVMAARPLSRREALRIGLAGSSLALFGRACQSSATGPGPDEPPTGEEPVYALTAGDSLYDDFDGHGCFQTYDGRDQATAAALAERLWVHNDRAEVVDRSSLLGNQAAVVEVLPDHVLEVGSVGQLLSYAWLNSPREIDFADFGSLRADVLLSSRSTAPHPCAGLNFHTTIPEQPPGRSWQVTLGIYGIPGESGALVIGQYANLNLGILQNDTLGPAALDEWHALRLDIMTKAGDPALGEQDLRLDYYLDGVLKASRIPEDSAILIDPARTGLGPHRSLIVTRDGYEGVAYGYFDDVRARYLDRIA
jgi:hypothetical protein